MCDGYELVPSDVNISWSLTNTEERNSLLVR